MKYFHLNAAGKVDQIAESLKGLDRANWICRADREFAEKAAQIAADVTALTGEDWIVTDAGKWVSPRIDVKRAPKVGDEVSRYINGDCYPDGVITHVSAAAKGHKIVKTSNGRSYYRSKASGNWHHNGCWSLVFGHHNERNPHI